MKTLTLVCNFVLLGFACVGILTDGLVEETGSLSPGFLMIAAAIINIIMIAGSTINSDQGSSERFILSKREKSFYLFMKIFAIILNTSLHVIVAHEFHTGSGSLFSIFMAYISLTLILSIVRIGISRWNMFKGLKRTVFTSGIIIVFLFIGTFTIFRILIENCSLHTRSDKIEKGIACSEVIV